MMDCRSSGVRDGQHVAGGTARAGECPEGQVCDDGELRAGAMVLRVPESPEPAEMTCAALHCRCWMLRPAL